MNDFFFLTACLGLAAAIVAGWLPLRIGRIAYWSGAAVTSASVFLMAFPPDWKSGLLMSAFAVCATTGIAYVNTKFIRIGGKTYSLFADPGTIDDYGVGLTPTKTWWLAVFSVALLTAIGVLAVIDEAGAWIPLAAGAIVVFAAVSLGFRDALAARPLAAGQKAQLALLTVATLGVFAACYFAAYQVGRRRTPNR